MNTMKKIVELIDDTSDILTAKKKEYIYLVELSLTIIVSTRVSMKKTIGSTCNLLLEY